MHPSKKIPALFAGLLLTVAAVSFFRDPTSYLLPPLAYEDGRDMFAFFYNHREPGAVLRFYNGYISLVPNLVGYGAMGLPTPWVPKALALVPLLFASLAFCWLYLPVYRRLIPHDGARLAVCLALALAPVANSFFIANTTYSIWSLLLLLVWLSLAPPPERPAAAAGRFAVMAALIWSHPLSLALVPVWLATAAWCARGGGGRARRPERVPARVPVLFYGGLTAAAVLYQIFGVEPRGLSPPGPASILYRTAVFTLERVVFATGFGDAATAFLRRSGGAALIPATAALLLLAAGALTWRYRRRLSSHQRFALAVLVYLSLAFTALYVVGRSPTLDILGAGRAFRYFWVQRLLGVATLGIAAAAWIRGLRRRPGPGTAAGLLALAVVYVSILNFNNNGSYTTRARAGRAVADFTAEVARQEATGDGSVDARLERGMWSLELHRRGRLPGAGP